MRIIIFVCKFRDENEVVGDKIRLIKAVALCCFDLSCLGCLSYEISDVVWDLHIA